MPETETKVGEIYQLIPQIMQKIGVIGKGRRNDQQNYAFRGIDDMYNAIQPVLCELRVFVVPTVITESREERQTRNGGTLIYTTLKMAFRFFAPDGSYIEATTVGEAMDSGDKSSNKAQSAAMKYAFLQVFCIPTEGDNDTDNNSPDPAGRKPQQKPATAAANANANADPLADNEKFVEIVKDALKEWDSDDVPKLISKVCKAKKVTLITKFSLKERHGFLDAIKSGKFDNMRTAAPVGAGK